MADEERKPDGKQKASESKAGNVTRLESLSRAAMRSAPKPDLDMRNQQMVAPRKPMGPPLEEPDASLAPRRLARAAQTIAPTDPAATSTAEPRGARSAPRTKARRVTKRAARGAKKSAKKSSSRRRR